MAIQAISPSPHPTGNFWAKIRKKAPEDFGKWLAGFEKKVAHFKISWRILGKLSGSEF
jgi:hypothetical protein